MTVPRAGAVCAARARAQVADGDLTGRPRRRRPLVGRIRGLRRHGDVLLVGTIEGRVYAVDAGSLSP